MDDAELRQKLDGLEKRLDAVYVSAEKTRKYFLAIIVISIVVFVVPLIGLFFAVPAFISTYSQLGAL